MASWGRALWLSFFAIKVYNSINMTFAQSLHTTGRNGSGRDDFFTVIASVKHNSESDSEVLYI